MICMPSSSTVRSVGDLIKCSYIPTCSINSGINKTLHALQGKWHNKCGHHRPDLQLCLSKKLTLGATRYFIYKHTHTHSAKDLLLVLQDILYINTHTHIKAFNFVLKWLLCRYSYVYNCIINVTIC